MESYICRTCGVEYTPSELPPERCIICEDERQWVGWEGQQWVTMTAMREEGYKNRVETHEPDLIGIGTEPRFGIGQRSLLVQTTGGNLLWDPITNLDDDTRRQVVEMGGIQAIAASHPHFYGAMVEWSHTFGYIPVYVPQDDRGWVTRPDNVLKFWSREVELFRGVTLVQCGGHFPGSAVIHWADGAEGRGTLLVGDSMTVVRDRRYVSFMFSYPNIIPLAANNVIRIADTVKRYRFDRIYGAWWDSIVDRDGTAAVERSAQRYVKHLQGS